MSRKRFLLVILLAFAPACTLTVLFMDVDARICAIDPLDLKAAGYNLAVTAWNARQASARLEGIVQQAGNTVEAAKPLLDAATARVRQLEEPEKDLAGAVINLRDAIAQVKGGAGPVLQHADELLVSAKLPIENAGRVTGEIADSIPAIHNTLDVVSENADLLGRCEFELPDGTYWGNPDCFANRLIPALKSLERVSTVVEREVPGTAQAVREASQQGAGIAFDLHQISSRVAKPESTLGRIFEVAKLAVEALVHIF
jgi:hypothetical protein